MDSETASNATQLYHSPGFTNFEVCVPNPNIPPIVPAGFLPLRLVMLWMILTPVACMDPSNNQDTSSNLPVAKAAITLTSGILAATFKR